MKRNIEQIGIVVFIMGIMVSFFSICSSFFANVYTMTDEQYALEAQKIVYDSLSLCQSCTDTVE